MAARARASAAATAQELEPYDREHLQIVLDRVLEQMYGDREAQWDTPVEYGDVAVHARELERPFSLFRCSVDIAVPAQFAVRSVVSRSRATEANPFTKSQEELARLEPPNPSDPDGLGLVSVFDNRQVIFGWKIHTIFLFTNRRLSDGSCIGVKVPVDFEDGVWTTRRYKEKTFALSYWHVRSTGLSNCRLTFAYMEQPTMPLVRYLPAAFSKVLLARAVALNTLGFQRVIQSDLAALGAAPRAPGRAFRPLAFASGSASAPLSFNSSPPASPKSGPFQPSAPPALGHGAGLPFHPPAHPAPPPGPVPPFQQAPPSGPVPPFHPSPMHAPEDLPPAPPLPPPLPGPSPPGPFFAFTSSSLRTPHPGLAHGSPLPPGHAPSFAPPGSPFTSPGLAHGLQPLASPFVVGRPWGPPRAAPPAVRPNELFWGLVGYREGDEDHADDPPVCSQVIVPGPIGRAGPSAATHFGEAAQASCDLAFRLQRMLISSTGAGGPPPSSAGSPAAPRAPERKRMSPGDEGGGRGAARRRHSGDGEAWRESPRNWTWKEEGPPARPDAAAAASFAADAAGLAASAAAAADLAARTAASATSRRRLSGPPAPPSPSSPRSVSPPPAAARRGARARPGPPAPPPPFVPPLNFPRLASPPDSSQDDDREPLFAASCFVAPRSVN